MLMLVNVINPILFIERMHPLELRYKRELYFDYVKAEKLPTANDVNLARKMINSMKVNIPWLIRVLYPIKKIYEYNRKSQDFSFYSLGDIKDFLKLLKLSGGRQIGWASLAGITLLIRAYGYDYKKLEEIALNAAGESNS